MLPWPCTNGRRPSGKTLDPVIPDNMSIVEIDRDDGDGGDCGDGKDIKETVVFASTDKENIKENIAVISR